MTQVTVQTLNDSNGKGFPLFEQIGKRISAIEKRAFEFFESRGRSFGNDLEDWLKAERELGWWEPYQLVEHDGAYRLELALPGFETREVEVTATEEELVVHAKATYGAEPGEIVCREYGFSEVYRRFAMLKAIDVDGVKATLHRGMLTVEAPLKVLAAASPPRVMAATAG